MVDKKYTLSVVTRLQDNGDGGYTLYAYNDDEEMLADHPLANNGAVSDEDREAILNEDDPYENGYISSDIIYLSIDESGNIKLDKPISFHAGQ